MKLVSYLDKVEKLLVWLPWVIDFGTIFGNYTLIVRNMTRDKRLEIRLSEENYRKLESYANQKDISMAQVLREYIKRLPRTKD